MNKFLNTITKGDSFELIKVINNESIDLVLTDPPYFINGNRGFKGKEWDSSKSLLDNELIYKIENKLIPIKQAKIEYTNAVSDYFINMTEVLIPKVKKDGTMIFFNRLRNLETIKKRLEKDTFSEDEWSKTKNYKYQKHPNSRWALQLVEWKKKNPNPNMIKSEQSEYALIAQNMTISNPMKIRQAFDYWIDSFDGDNQYYATSPANSKTIFYDKSKHVSPKPISLWSNLMKRFSEPNDLVLDIFSGSGTTALVAEDLGRNYIAFEFEDEQVNLSLERLDKFKETMPPSLFIYDDLV